ncbi:PspC domain-containing protein [Acrocarpospora catenulata]|uniref:PspC domain-containing protein n=1 Tax=Acrocarpospora catenulata TaxID=2836182 RepID=UPI001BDA0BD3|nr:PspC domain-containing protein [Acrocarpospora catenulata]
MNEMMTNGSVKQLRRTRNGKVIAGVCSGVGEYVGIDPNILRVGLAIASLFGGLGVGIYAVAWLLIPADDRNASIVQDLIDKNKDNPVWLDAKSKAEKGWAKATNHQGGNSYQYPRPTSDPYAHHPYAQQPKNDKPAV